MNLPKRRWSRRRWRGLAIAIAVLAFDVRYVAAQTVAGPAPNLALGRPYTLTPRPNYLLTTDADDDRQLTDGAYTAWDPIWLRPSTVGWQYQTPVTIVVDLQSVQPIGGMSFRTAAGRAGVQWPRSIFVLVSDDNHRFYPVGDLTLSAASPPSTGFAAYRYASSGLRTHGRYVAFVVEPTGPYLFCDEIEVQQGDQSSVDQPLVGDSTTDLQDYFVKAHQRVSVQWRLAADLSTARTSLANASVDADLRTALTQELNAINAAIGGLPMADPKAVSAILPLNDLHARIFAVQGQLAQAAGWPSLSVWATNPWDFARMLDKPPPGAARDLSIAAMNGEIRSGVVSLSNSTGRAIKVSLSIGGDAGAVEDLRLYDVAWTDTRELIPVADALLPLPAQDALVDLPAGVTRQIWISFSPRHRDAGTSQAFIAAQADDGSSGRVPISLRVFAGQFPNRPTLHVGGWDYTNEDGLGLTARNTPALIDALRGLGVDSPWATSSAMPPGGFSAAGHLSQLPDTSNFDSWVSKWPGATRYCVFLSVGDAIGAVPVSDGPAFATAVGEWITFWVAHAGTLGIQPAQLSLLLVDEPVSAAQDARIAAWGRAIKIAQPQVALWEDPNMHDPGAAPLGLLDVSDELALKRTLIDQLGSPFLDFYRAREQGGQRLAIYGASGPARLLDPYTYYRLQPWLAASIGANTSFFWSFADDADGHSWNEYAASGTGYSPFFLSDDRITLSRHTEALREGVEDFEYLSMLRRRVKAAGDGGSADGFGQASALLQGATDSVLGSQGAGDTSWTTDKDRLGAEAMRLRIGELLESLGGDTTQPPHVSVTGGAFVYDGAAHAATATVADVSGLPIAGSLTIAYTPGGSAPPVHAGTYVATAIFSSADSKFGNATATGLVSIAPTTPAIAVGGHALYDGHTHPATATATGQQGAAIAGKFTLTYTPGGTAAPTDPGTYAVAAAFSSGDPDYRDAAAIGSLTIDWPLVSTLLFPPNGATGVDLPVPFQWLPIASAERYYLYVGTAPGAKDLVNTGEITATSYHADALPRGRNIFVRLWTKSGGIWRSTDSQFVMPAPTTVQISDTQVAFDGRGHIPTATAVSADGAPVSGSFAFTYATGDGSPPVHAGTYIVIGRFTSADPRFRDAQATGSLTIVPAVPRVTVSTERFAYDGRPHGASALAAGVDSVSVPGDFTFDYSPGTGAPANAGAYDVTTTFASRDPDYTGARAAGSVTILPIAPIVSVATGSPVFDGAAHAAQASVVDLMGRPIAGVLGVTYAPGGAAAPLDAGAYAVSVTFVSADANYTNADAAGMLTIVPATPRIVVAGKTFSYDGQPHSTSAVATGVDGLSVSGSLVLAYAPGSSAVPVTAGSYTVSAAFTSANPNYASASATGSIVIQNAPLVAKLTYPPDGATTVDLKLALQWMAVDRPDAYYVYVGTTRGASDLVNTGEIAATSWSISNRLRGETLFVRLWTKVQGMWRYSDSTFIAPRLIATMTYPTADAVVVDVSRPLRWTAVDGAQAYYLYVGTTPGARNVVDTGEITGTSYLAASLPTGQVLYARVWTKVGGLWRYSDSVLTAAPSVISR